jgi:hypothetical protein
MESSKIINSESTDKEFGMNFCEKLIRLEGKDIRTIFWVKTDENGHHHYQVSWSEMRASSR